MKKYIVLLLVITSLLYGCQPTKEKGNKHIQSFFKHMLEFKCPDNTPNRVQYQFRYFGFNQEKGVLEFTIPDSLKNADFYNAYAGRLSSAYYACLNAKGNNFIDSLFVMQACDCDKLRENVTEYYCKDSVFMGIFNTAFSSFYFNKKESPEYKDVIDKNRSRIGIDSLLQIAFAYIDIEAYIPDRGFACHFGCGSPPFAYTPENKVSFLISGFCQEALDHPTLKKEHLKIIKSLAKEVEAAEGDIQNPDELCKKYEKKLHRILLEEGMLKKALLEYYEKRKDIEPFEII